MAAADSRPWALCASTGMPLPFPATAIRSSIGRREELAHLSLDGSVRDAAVLEQLLARPGPRNACHRQAMHRCQVSDRRAHGITETAAQRVILDHDEGSRLPRRHGERLGIEGPYRVGIDDP